MIPGLRKEEPIGHNVHRFDLIYEALIGPMTPTDKKIRRTTATTRVEIMTDYAEIGSWP